MARITADADLRTRLFEQGADRMRRVSRDTGRSIRRSFTGILSGVMAYGGVRRMLEDLDRIGKLSKRFEVPAEDLQRVGFAAEQSGADLEAVARTMGYLQRSVNDARLGVERKTQALEELGLNLKMLQDMTAAEKFFVLADAMAGASDEGKAFANALEIGGRGVQELIPLLKEGSAGMRELGEQIPVVSGEDVADIERFNDSLNRLGRTIMTMAAGPLSALARGLEATRKGWVGIIEQVRVANKAMGNGASLREAWATGLQAARDKVAGIEGRRTADEPRIGGRGRGIVFADEAPDYGKAWGARRMDPREEGQGLGTPGVGAGIFGGLLNGLLGGAAMNAEARRREEIERGREELERFREAMMEMRRVTLEDLGQFRSIGSNERNPLVEKQLETQRRIEENTRQAARRLEELADKDLVAELTAEFSS